jgi:hypothetical protein
MKPRLPLIGLLAVAATSCSTTPGTSHRSVKADPETVLVTYHVKPGKDAELQAVLARAWQIYESEHLVYGQPHIVVRESEAGDKTRFVEIFTWVSHAAPEHAPESVKAVWAQEQAFCAENNGQGGIQGGEVEILKCTR